MRSHGILDASMGIVCVVHGNIAVTVAKVRSSNGRLLSNGIRSGSGSSSGVNGGSAVVLVVFVCWRWRLSLARVVPGHLGAAVVSSRSTGRGRVVV